MNRLSTPSLIVSVLMVSALTSSGGGGVALTGPEGQLPVLAAGVGLRLRLQGRAVPLAGRLVSFDSDSIVLQPWGEKARRAVGWHSIEAVEVAHRRTLAGLGAGVAAGVAAGAIWSVKSGEGVGADAFLGGALIALPAAAAGVAVGGGEHPSRDGALLGAFLDAVGLGIPLGGWCAAWDRSASDSCFLEAALLGAAFGALSGGVAAHVSRRHWTPVWVRRATVGIVPAKGRGAALVVRLAF